MILMSRIEEVMTEDTLEETLDPKALAKSVAIVSADDPEDVGDFANQIELGDDVTDFRFICLKRGYEGWQWAVTLYHDQECDTWTVNESSLVPTDESLLAPAWVPWKDRLEAKDISVTDVLGTDPNDSRMEDGFRRTEAGESKEDDNAADAVADKADTTPDSGSKADGDVNAVDTRDDKSDKSGGGSVSSDQTNDDADTKTESSDIDPETGLSVDAEEAIEDFHLSRRHVMSPMGRSQTAQRWYQGQHGPKSLSTKISGGNLCSTCAFFIGLKGDLDTMFGVCANRWSPDDGRVVSVDHGCGEHSEIEESEPTRLWVQSKPAFDDLHIDIIAQKPREERGQVELIEALDGDETDAGTDGSDEDTANDDDIKRHAVPASLEDETDDDSDPDDDDTEAEAEVSAVTDVESTIDLSDDSDDSGDSDEDADEARDDTEDDDPEDDDADGTDDSDESAEGSDDDVSDSSDSTDDSDDSNDTDDADDSVDSDKSDDSTATDTDDDSSNQK